MPTELFPTFLLQMLIVGYTPGPANIYALTMSLQHGRKPAINMWFGLLTGFTVAAMGLALLTHYIGVAFAAYIPYLKYVGAAYIFYLAYQQLNGASRPQRTQQACSFQTGFWVQFTNAKMLLFDLTCFSTFVLPYSRHLIDLISTAALLVFAGPIANLVWLFLGSSLRMVFAQYGKQIQWFSAIALASCALFILFG